MNAWGERTAYLSAAPEDGARREDG
jgi:hypothetical protein